MVLRLSLLLAGEERQTALSEFYEEWKEEVRALRDCIPASLRLPFIVWSYGASCTLLQHGHSSDISSPKEPWHAFSRLMS